MAETVVVGMSGGVDSSAAAWILKEQGYRVIGVTIRTWRERDAGPDAASGAKPDARQAGSENAGPDGFSDAAADARRVAGALGIPHYVFDCREAFRKDVVDYFVREYERGRTPNPCVFCNRFVKWEALLNRSRELGADFIATGHYARKILLPNGRYTLQNSATAEKDQTYALFQLTQEQLKRTLFPDGDYTKPEIRRIAASAGLMTASKPDSEEICFIPDNDYAGFIERYTGKIPVPGNFVDTDGNILGRHAGICRYTVGQRRGLGIAFGRRMFVKELRPAENEVVLAENSGLFTDRLTCSQINWMAVPDLSESEVRRVTVKIRYSHRGSAAVIRKTGTDTVLCTFDSPVRAVTPGQAAVFYEDGHVLGGGIIDSDPAAAQKP